MDRFLELARKYTDFDQLTTPMLNEFVDRIIIHAPEKVERERVQEVEIYLKYIGKFEAPVPELTEDERNRQAHLKKERIRSRERYRKLKSGERTVGAPITLTCRCCGKEFEATRTNPLFCDRNCRARYYRQEAAAERSRERVCQNCGKAFITTRNNVKYCCDACLDDANRKLQRKRNVARRTTEAEQNRKNA